MLLPHRFWVSRLEGPSPDAAVPQSCFPAAWLEQEGLAWRNRRGWWGSFQRPGLPQGRYGVTGSSWKGRMQHSQGRKRVRGRACSEGLRRSTPPPPRCSGEGKAEARRPGAGSLPAWQGSTAGSRAGRDTPLADLPILAAGRGPPGREMAPAASLAPHGACAAGAAGHRPLLPSPQREAACPASSVGRLASGLLAASPRLSSAAGLGPAAAREPRGGGGERPG